MTTRIAMLSVGVAIAAMIATALVADRIARDDLEAALDRDLDAETAIVDSILVAGAFSGTWDDVDQVVTALSEEFDVRIALTDLEDVVVSDSAGPPGDTPLPSREVAFVDPGDIFGDSFVVPSEFDDIPIPDIVIGEASSGVLDELGIDAIEEIDTLEPLLLYLGDAGDEESSVVDSSPDWRLLATLGIVATLAAFVSVLTARTLTRPLQQLAAAASRLGDGDLTARSSPEGPTDIAQVSSTFNSMAERIEHDTATRHRFTSDVAHELRTPLTNMQGYLEGAQDGLIPVDSSLLDGLHDDTMMLGRIVEDLQTLLVADRHELVVDRQPVSIARVIETTARFHRDAAHRAGVALDVEPGPDLVVLGDEMRLRQVMNNLVANALRHTPRGGIVRLSATDRGSAVAVSVTDSGEGIAEQHLPYIFDRFYRADAARARETGGSGLGLAIAREIVTAHDGVLTVQSRPGEGTTFTATLPTSG